MTDYNFETATPINLKVRVGVADVTLDAAPRERTTVLVAPSDPASRADCEAAARVKVTHDGDEVRVTEPQGRRVRGSYDVRVSLPGESRAQVTSGAGDVTLNGPLDTVDIRTGSGDVDVEHATEIHVSCGSGDVALGAALGHAQLRTGSGNVCVREANDGVEAKTGSGDLRIDAAQGGDFDLVTGSGDITVRIPEGVAALLDAVSGLGTVDSQLAPSDAKLESDRSIAVRAKSGTGNVLIGRAAVG